MTLDASTFAMAGRFAPLTRDEAALLLDACAGYGQVVIRITGADCAPSTQTPWSAGEREAMIRAALGPLTERVTFQHVRDYRYRPDLASKAMVETLPVESLPDVAAPIRAAFLREGPAGVRDLVPEAVLAWLQAFASTPAFEHLHAEQVYIDDYRKSWAVAPYPPIFVMVDAVIEHGEHVLLVKRGGQPGRGQWALPGGFVDDNETLLDAALREVVEETGLDLAPGTVSKHLLGNHVFDDPKRSARGRTITHAFHFRFSEGEVPKVEAADDAAQALWVPIYKLESLRDQLFEDHGDILDYFGLIASDGGMRGD
ncbi:Bifunctional NMN adenylyltransferase/Nudix hydrolase (plasmid) [Asticcacaulis sp. MM231]|uniref:NUDIX domain-containing protein n=1 Tax=Asticcacaulis sp. MM231 TaxID=3157666 RepID=UPI0032D5AC81